MNYSLISASGIPMYMCMFGVFMLNVNGASVTNQYLPLAGKIFCTVQ